MFVYLCKDCICWTRRLYDFGIVVLWVVQDFYYYYYFFFSCWTRRLFDLESYCCGKSLHFVYVLLALCIDNYFKGHSCYILFYKNYGPHFMVFITLRMATISTYIGEPYLGLNLSLVLFLDGIDFTVFYRKVKPSGSM